MVSVSKAVFRSSLSTLSSRGHASSLVLPFFLPKRALILACGKADEDGGGEGDDGGGGEGNDGGGDGGGTLYHGIGKPANYNAQSDNNLSFHHAFHKGARLWAIHECAWNVHDSPFLRALPLGVTTRSQTRARVVPWDTWRACGRGGRHPGRRARRTPSPG